MSSRDPALTLRVSLKSTSRLVNRGGSRMTAALSHWIRGGVLIILVSGLCQAEDRRQQQATQQFRVIVPPRMELAHDSSGDASRLTVRASIDLLIRLESLPDTRRAKQRPLRSISAPRPSMPRTSMANPSAKLLRGDAADERQMWRTDNSAVTMITLPVDAAADRGLRVLTIVPLD